jgi:oxygen-independent coproporphyrinogen-3 oxidase
MLYEPNWADRFLKRLFFELDAYGLSDLETLYVGGGTPTSLSMAQLESLLVKLHPLITPNTEFTVEANIENAAAEKLALLKRYGVNRISLGVQTMDPAQLRGMNRHHRPEDVKKTIEVARALGFMNISVDLIYDLPGQTDKGLKHDLEAILAFEVPHISTYSLTIHPQTVFGIRKIVPACDDVSRRHYDLILDTLRRHGYERYEVSNFAKPGFYGRHNLNYWTNGYFVGVGLGSSGYLPGFRYQNTMNFTRYLSGMTVASQDPIDIKTQETDFLMLGLRLAQGFDAQTYKKLFAADFTTRYHDAILKLTGAGLIQTDGKRWYATDEGLMLLDQVVLTLIKEVD